MKSRVGQNEDVPNKVSDLSTYKYIVELCKKGSYIMNVKREVKPFWDTLVILFLLLLARVFSGLIGS
ncbi:hypothetical protein BN000_02483 [Neobacillus massiliamazoniensis]|uniref:Uncharacterized protein n=1 Tax=Neobacillus massiliamazoniensis TaxID=1499688 RepID=A0A0U1NWZ8_9BACI|nr:hypothetical protein BN000_02483 [Neobacillus massiliamazoniensis]